MTNLPSGFMWDDDYASERLDRMTEVRWARAGQTDRDLDLCAGRVDAMAQESNRPRVLAGRLLEARGPADEWLGRG